MTNSWMSMSKQQYTEEELQLNSSPLIEPKYGVEDWSTVHCDTESLKQKCSTPEQWNQFKFTREQIEQYRREGYIAPIKVLSHGECDKLLRDYEGFLNSENQHPLFYEFHKNQTGDINNVLMHALGHWRITRQFHDLVFHPAICVPASQLLSFDDTPVRVRLWHDQLFAKPANHGGCVAWHQDYSYWTRTYPMQHLTIHVALDEQTVENGCIHYVPRSHQWTRNNKPLPVTDFNFKDMESIKQILTEQEKENFKPIPCLLKKGEASFHHPLTVHGSYPNRSSLPRRATVVNYFADGVKSNTDDPLLLGTNAIPKHQVINGQFYPLVYDPKWKMQSQLSLNSSKK